MGGASGSSASGARGIGRDVELSIGPIAVSSVASTGGAAVAVGVHGTLDEGGGEVAGTLDAGG